MIAPDSIGFGRSDKPFWISYHTHSRHVDNLADFILKFELKHNISMRRIKMAQQDWGGLFGIRLLVHPKLINRFKDVEVFATNILQLPITVPPPFTDIAYIFPEFFSAIVDATNYSARNDGISVNGFVPYGPPEDQYEKEIEARYIPSTLQEIAALTDPMLLLPFWIAHTWSYLELESGEWVVNKERASDFLSWEVVNIVTSNLEHKVLNTEREADGKLAYDGVLFVLKDPIKEAFEAPFPLDYPQAKIAPIVFPSLIPSEMSKNKEDWIKLKKLNQYELKFHTFFSERDPVTKTMDSFFWELPSSRNQKHVRFDHKGHFFPFDYGKLFADKILETIISVETPASLTTEKNIELIKVQ